MLAASNQYVRWSDSLTCPRTGRRQDEIAFPHFAAPPVHDRHRALGARRKADRRGGVPVRHGVVARLQDGERADEVRRGHRVAAERRIRHDDRAALDVLDRHFLRRAAGERLEIAPGPVHGLVPLARRDRRDALVAVPEGVVVRALERADEIVVEALRAGEGLAHVRISGSCGGRDVLV
jgi:hypothetical protein